MELIIFLIMLWVARQCFQYALVLLGKMLGIKAPDKKEGSSES